MPAANVTIQSVAPNSRGWVAQVTPMTPIGEEVGAPWSAPAESTDTESMAKPAVREQGGAAGAAPPITDDARVAPWDGWHAATILLIRRAWRTGPMAPRTGVEVEGGRLLTVNLQFLNRHR